MENETIIKIKIEIKKIAKEVRKKSGGTLRIINPYIFAFLSYNQISAKALKNYRETLGLKDGEEIDFNNLNGITFDELKEECLDLLGYYVDPEFLWENIVKKVERNEFDLEYINKIFKTLESNGNNQMQGIFNSEVTNLNSVNLGSDVNIRKSVIKTLILSIDNVNFDLNKEVNDVIGDCFEILLEDAAINDDGAYYTPQHIADILVNTSITRIDKPKLSIYDPTCGTAGLLINALKINNKVNKLTGQEKDPITSNLAKLNMFIRSPEGTIFNIFNANTLTDPMIEESEKFDAIIANPPYGVDYEPEEIKNLTIDTYKDLTYLPPKTHGEMLFLHHIMKHLNSDGIASVVMPKGITFRTNSGEKEIRKKYLKQTETIILLPRDIFYASIPTLILVMNNNHNKDFVRFVDARSVGTKVNKKIVFSDKEVKDIVEMTNSIKDQKKSKILTYLISHDRIRDLDYNINLDAHITVPRVDLDDIETLTDKLTKQNEEAIRSYSKIKKLMK